MSDIAADYTDRLNLREQIVRIDRAIAETHKFQAEAAKLNRDRFLAPLLAAGAMAGVVGAVIPLILRSWGIH